MSRVVVQVSLILMVIGVTGGRINGQETFRGIQLDQTYNRHFSHAFGDHWFIDLADTFSDAARPEQLADSYVDGISIGFVPPTSGDPHVSEFGRWMGSTDYVVDTSNSGTVGRQTGDGVGVTCIPWRVTPELGDFYLIEMTSVVAEGESVRLGYFGDVNVLGSSEGLVGDLGQLVLDVTRGEGAAADSYAWTIDSPKLASPISDTFDFTGEDLRLQLGWNENEDKFDAWIESNDGDLHLAYGSLDGAIDVVGVGLELTGTGSRVQNFITAVPEPAGMPLFILGLLAIVAANRRMKR
ncbi:hypothetical protein ACFL2H_12265 [Planctomycetota bacterium]